MIEVGNQTVPSQDGEVQLREGTRPDKGLWKINRIVFLNFQEMRSWMQKNDAGASNDFLRDAEAR